MKKKILLLALLLSLIYDRSMATVVYVDSSNISGSQDGNTWASAFYSFQYGIDFANPGDTIWVAKGTYLPIAGTHFILKEGVKIYAGFLNSHTSFGERNWQINTTILRGNGNSVIRNDSAAGITLATVLDGFRITKGRSISYDCGGGMSNRYASPKVSNCSFISNACSPYALGGGGGMYNFHSSPEIYNCSFSYDTAKIFLGLPPNASGSGGGGAISNAYSSPTITRCTFSDNMASEMGGAIYNSLSSAPVVSYCTFTRNRAQWGGAINTDRESVHLSDSCTFSFNVGVYGASIYNDTIPAATITRCVFLYNTGANGTGIYNMKTANILIDSCYFERNTASFAGGAMLNSECSPVITNTRFLYNKSVDAPGGSINNYHASVTLNNCTFTGNKSNYAGGAIYLNGYNGTPSAISNCTFTRDTSLSNSGGAIFCIGNVPLIMNNSVFTENVSSMDGGAVVLTSGTAGNPSLTSCTFTGNKTLTGYGGAIANFNAASTITNCTFTGNSAPANNTGGGAFYNDGNSYVTPVINLCNFSGNSAYQGGGIFNKSDYTFPAVKSCTFNNNTAVYQGGAISGYLTQLTKSTFTGNTAHYGGAVHTPGYPIQFCLFSGNTAWRGGGVMSIGSTKMVNCIFAKNVADTFGGGMYNSAPPAYVTNSTFCGNKAGSLGGPIYNTNFGNYNDSSFTNCVIWGNNSGVYNQNTGSSAFSYSLVQGLGAFAAKHLIAGTTNPMFTDTASGNYTLQATSPCIDMGKNAFVPDTVITDYAGDPRIHNSIVDLGAFEYGNFPLSLDLIRFSGKLQPNNTAILEWETVADGMGYIRLQRSEDGRNFTTIYSVPAVTSGRGAYTFTDDQVLAANHYRLELSNEQGALSYSKTILLQLQQTASLSRVYPNPAKEQVTLAIGDQNALHTSVILCDLFGKVISKTKIIRNLQTISLSGLSTGIYILKMENGTNLKIEKQ